MWQILDLTSTMRIPLSSLTKISKKGSHIFHPFDNIVHWFAFGQMLNPEKDYTDLGTVIPSNSRFLGPLK